MGQVVYTGGTFDLFHSGHVNLLAKCKQLAGEGGSVIVSLNRDEFIESYKGKAPVMSFEERMTILEACRYVDIVVENSGDEDSTLAILNNLPDLIVIGSDWATKDYYKQMNFTQEWLDDLGISLCYVPYTAGISTTDLKQRIADKQVK